MFPSAKLLVAMVNDLISEHFEAQSTLGWESYRANME